MTGGTGTGTACGGDNCVAGCVQGSVAGAVLVAGASSLNVEAVIPSKTAGAAPITIPL
jgi:hypothetical protein